jgi:hypothetical protein
MAEAISALTTMGILGLADGTNALLVGSPGTPTDLAATTSEPAIPSGGKVVLTEQDMPSLQTLLEEHRVKTAILYVEATRESVALEAGLSWHAQAQSRLRDALERSGSLDPLDEDFAFLAALDDENLDRFLHEADEHLGRSVLSPASWERFLHRWARQAFSPLELLEPEPPAVADEDENRPLFELGDLAERPIGGAIGSPTPLPHRRA